VFISGDFILQSPDKRLSALLEDADELRALAAFFSSSIVRYFLFFHSPAWGVDRNRIYKRDIKQIPVPILTEEQVAELALLQKELAAQESDHNLSVDILQDILDEKLEKLLNIPKSVNALAKDFMRVRLSLNKGSLTGIASQPPHESDLLEYGHFLRDELDAFTKDRVHHRVTFINLPDQEMVVCEVEATNAKQQSPIGFANANGQMKPSLSQLKQKLRQRFSQWVYVQRGLRVFNGSKVYICKAPRLIDWTKTQALNDADDLIAEVLSGNFGERGVAVNGRR